MEQEHLTLKEYLTTAKRVISHMRTNVRPTEDNISDVATAMMKADKKFNGYGVRSSYRISIGKYMVKEISRRLAIQNSRVKIISLSSAVNSSDNRVFSEFIVDHHEESPGLDLAESIIQKHCPEVYKELIIDKFMNNLGSQELIAKYNCSRQNISQKIGLALKCMRESLIKDGIENIGGLL